jgi:hypothetical protein
LFILETQDFSALSGGETEITFGRFYPASAADRIQKLFSFLRAAPGAFYRIVDLGDSTQYIESGFTAITFVRI